MMGQISEILHASKELPQIGEVSSVTWREALLDQFHPLAGKRSPAGAYHKGGRVISHQRYVLLVALHKA